MFELRKFLRRTAALFAFLPTLSPAALISDFEDTWTDGGTNYLIHGNVTDTSSAADSQLLGLSVGGTDKFYVLKDGTITVTGPIVSLANGDITLTPNGTGNVVLGAFTLDADQTVGAGQDNYVLTYDDAAGTIGLEASSVTPAGADTQVQWNNAGVLGAASTFTYDDSTYTFKLGYNGSNYCQWVSAADGALTLSCLGTDADLNIALSGATDGDFSVNTDDLFVDTSTGSVGINTVAPSSSSKLDVYGKIYQNGVQSLYNPSATLTGTMVVGNGGVSLSHAAGNEGYYNVYVGIDAGGNATTQSRMTANGYGAARNNTGDYVTALGAYSAYNNTASNVTASGYNSAQINSGDKLTTNGVYSSYSNTGNYVTTSGYSSSRYNTGDFVTANGYGSAQTNTGDYATAIGTYSAYNNAGDNVVANGAYSAYNNTGASVTATGAYSARYNGKDNVTAVGFAAYDSWVNGTSYSITSADAGADTVTVTGHGITIGTSVPLLASGSGIGGLSNGDVNVFKAIDANTLQPLGVNITSSGTATLYANSKNFANVTALGYNAEPTKDNQVMLGDTNVVEVKTSGTVVTPALQTTTALITATNGGSTPAFKANVVGSTGGPTTAAQNGWLKMKDSAGATIWVPVWK